MNLQLFADEGNEDVEDTQEETKDNELDINSILENPEFIKYMESHADKRVSSALAKKDKEYQAKLEAEKKKANMTAEELQQEKERELQEREQKLQQYELKLAKIDYFKEKDYDISLLDFVQGSDEEEIKENADKLIEVINKVVEKQVQERLKQNSYTPPKGDDDKSKFNMEDLKNMSPSEINKIWDKLK
ncbi:MAG TPA: DUF4355 domain-containing protein [Tissierellia bacterium]|nr:DUF4355 domain-containing protein [Tissierellia bacterium]